MGQDKHEKKLEALQMILHLQNKTFTLRYALGKLLQLCKNNNMQNENSAWWHTMFIAEEAMKETDANR